MIFLLGACLGAMCCFLSFTHDQSSDDPVDVPMLTLLSCQLLNDCVLVRVNFSRPPQLHYFPGMILTIFPSIYTQT
jgi:hypothetical protein